MTTFTFLCNLLPVEMDYENWDHERTLLLLSHTHQDHASKGKCGTKLSSGKRKRVKSYFLGLNPLCTSKMQQKSTWNALYKFPFHTYSTEGIFSAVLTSKDTRFAGSIFVTVEGSPYLITNKRASSYPLLFPKGKKTFYFLDGNIMFSSLTLQSLCSNPQRIQRRDPELHIFILINT